MGCRAVTKVGQMGGWMDGAGHSNTLRPEWAESKNEIIGTIFIFISITISYIFNWKQIQLESIKYQLSPWLIICTSFNGLSCHIISRARLGRITPLGRPRSVYKSNVECRFLSQNGQMALKVKVNDLHFNTSWKNTKMHIWCKFGDSSSNSLKVKAWINQIS